MVEEFLCMNALKYCAEARKLQQEGKYKLAGELCIRISKLCRRRGENTGMEECINESELCRKAGELFMSSENISEARKICQKSVKLCPRSKVGMSG